MSGEKNKTIKIPVVSIFQLYWKLGFLLKFDIFPKNGTSIINTADCSLG